MEVPDAFVQHWMREGAWINTLTIALTATPAQILPRNPLRLAVLLPRSSAANCFVYFTEMQVASANNQIFLPTQDSSSTFLYEQLGDIIRMPVWMSCSTPLGNLILQEISWAEAKYKIYRKVMDDFLSKHSTS